MHGTIPMTDAPNELPNLEKFIKIMKMTTVAEDALALVAIRQANAYLRQHFGGDWDRLLKGKVKVIGDPFDSAAPMPAPRRPDPDSFVRNAPPPNRPRPQPQYSPPPPRPTPPPPPPINLFRDRQKIESMLKKINLPTLKAASTKQRCTMIAADFKHQGYVTEKDWRYLCSVGATIRGASIDLDDL